MCGLLQPIINLSVIVTDSSSEDLPSFGIGCREQIDPQDDFSSSEGRRSPLEDPIHHEFDNPASSCEPS